MVVFPFEQSRHGRWHYDTDLAEMEVQRAVERVRLSGVTKYQNHQGISLKGLAAVKQCITKWRKLIKDLVLAMDEYFEIPERPCRQGLFDAD